MSQGHRAGSLAMALPQHIILVSAPAAIVPNR